MLLSIIALMFAAAADPLVRKLQRRGLGRGPSVAAVIGSITVGIVSVVLVVLSPVITEGQQFLTDLPGFVDRLERPLKDNPELFQQLRSAAERASSDTGMITGGVMQVGLGIVSVITDGFIVLVFTIFILWDGERIYNWTTRYFPQRYRRKLDRTIPAVSQVVSGYVTGQLITSFLFGTFAFAILSATGVPQPLFLAIVAAFGDAVPIVGVTVVTVPTVLIAFTVSPTVAVIVLAGYLIYQQLENYLLAPRIYQTTLKISSFAVLLAVLIGSALLGIVGALLALPIAAAIPVIEDIWLEDHPLRANIPEDPSPAPVLEVGPSIPEGPAPAAPFEIRSDHPASAQFDSSIGGTGHGNTEPSER